MGPIGYELRAGVSICDIDDQGLANRQNRVFVQLIVLVQQDQIDAETRRNRQQGIPGLDLVDDLPLRIGGRRRNRRRCGRRCGRRPWRGRRWWRSELLRCGLDGGSRWGNGDAAGFE